MDDEMNIRRKDFIYGKEWVYRLTFSDVLVIKAANVYHLWTDTVISPLCLIPGAEKMRTSSFTGLWAPNLYLTRKTNENF
jgi:hypothetical protein